MRKNILLGDAAGHPGARGLRQPAHQRAPHPVRPERWVPAIRPDSEARQQRSAHAVHPRVLRRRHARRGAVLWRAGRTAPHRGHDRRPAPPADRRGGHHHGRVGGKLTALAYALYGDRLFPEYEQRFLKRDVQGELVGRALNPFNWWKYIGGTAGRSELAAEYYDEILFEGATFGDLLTKQGPVAVANGTDISTGIGSRSTRTTSTCCARISTRSACRVRRPRPPPCPSSSRR